MFEKSNVEGKLLDGEMILLFSKGLCAFWLW